MIVVSDTSPITALLAIGKQDLLRSLFIEVLIPRAVHSELLRAHTALPDWLRVSEVHDMAHVERLLESLDRGESEAIVLAEESHADMLLIDERRGRQIATMEGLRVIGLVGVILLAKRRGLINAVAPVLRELADDAGMYLSDALVRDALASVGE